MTLADIDCVAAGSWLAIGLPCVKGKEKPLQGFLKKRKGEDGLGYLAHHWFLISSPPLVFTVGHLLHVTPKLLTPHLS